MVMVMVMVIMKMNSFISNNVQNTILKQLSKLNIDNSFFNSVKNSLSPFDNEFINPIKIDLHSHLLPGIDDGVRSIEESIRLIKEFKNLGFTKLITTPHIISDSYPNTKEIIDTKLSEIRDAIKRENIDIEIYAGAEHYIDMSFLELLEDDNLVPFYKNYVLFETSYTSKPIILEKAIFEMKVKGYIPVLAHPERYRYMHHDIHEYIKLKELGVLFQINIKSLRNSSGPVYDMLLEIIEHGLADFVGSDVHRQRDIDELKKFLFRKDYKNIFNSNTILNNTLV